MKNSLLLTSKRKLGKINLKKLVVPGLLIVISFSFYLGSFNSQLIAGYDSPFYLTMIEKIKVGKQSFLGSHIPMLFPYSVALLSQLLHITSLTALKISAIVMSVGLLASIWLFAKKHFSFSVSALALLLAFVMPSYERMTQDLFNNIAAFSFLILAFHFATKTNKGIHTILSGVFLGLCFWTHTLTPLIGLLIFVTYGFLGSILSKNLSLFFKALLIVAIGVFLSLPESLPFLISKPTSSDDPDFYVAPLLADMFQRVYSSLEELANNPWEVITTLQHLFITLSRWCNPVILTVGFLGALSICISIRKRFSEAKLLLLTTFVVPLLITISSEFGFLGFTERYVFFLLFSIPILAAYFLIDQLPKVIGQRILLNGNEKLCKLFVLVSCALIVITTYPKQISSIVNRRPHISESDYLSYQKVSDYVEQNDLVLLNNYGLYWFSVANPTLRTSIYEYYVVQYISQGIVDFGYYLSSAEYSRNAWIVAQNSGLSNEDLTQRLCELRASKNADQLYLFFSSDEPGVDIQRMKMSDKLFQSIFEINQYNLSVFNSQLCITDS